MKNTGSNSSDGRSLFQRLTGFARKRPAITTIGGGTAASIAAVLGQSALSGEGQEHEAAAREFAQTNQRAAEQVDAIGTQTRNGLNELGLEVDDEGFRPVYVRRWQPGDPVPMDAPAAGAGPDPDDEDFPPVPMDAPNEGGELADVEDGGIEDQPPERNRTPRSGGGGGGGGEQPVEAAGEGEAPIPIVDPDTDNDGLSDDDEVNVYGTDPDNPDSDGDLLSDGAEVEVYGTDPLDADTDGDGSGDGFEVSAGGAMDPLSGTKFFSVGAVEKGPTTSTVTCAIPSGYEAELQYSSDLSEWTSLRDVSGGYHLATTSLPNPQQCNFTHNHGGQPAMYYRVTLNKVDDLTAPDMVSALTVIGGDDDEQIFDFAATEGITNVTEDNFEIIKTGSATATIEEMIEEGNTLSGNNVCRIRLRVGGTGTVQLVMNNDAGNITDDAGNTLVIGGDTPGEIASAVVAVDVPDENPNSVAIDGTISSSSPMTVTRTDVDIDVVSFDVPVEFDTASSATVDIDAFTFDCDLTNTPDHSVGRQIDATCNIVLKRGGTEVVVGSHQFISGQQLTLGTPIDTQAPIPATTHTLSGSDLTALQGETGPVTVVLDPDFSSFGDPGSIHNSIWRTEVRSSAGVDLEIGSEGDEALTGTLSFEE